VYRKLWSENQKGRDYSEHLGADERIILEWMLGKQVGRCELDAYVSGCGPMAGLVNTVMNLRIP
jgi:hypothetical protein